MDPIAITAQGNVLKVGVSKGGPSQEVREVFCRLATKIKCEIKYIESDFGCFSTQLKEREIDISAHGVSKINENAPLESCVASDSYLAVQRGFCVKSDSQYAKAGKLDEDAKIAVVEATTANQDLERNYQLFLKNRHFVRSISEGRKLLDEGTVDAVAEGYLGFRHNPEDDINLPMIDVHPMDSAKPDAEYLVFWVHKDKQNIIPALNSIIGEFDGNIFKNRKVLTGNSNSPR
ncbi:transporter substrate-binding domain-containing protein [Sansalvadorimonas sp. 2012CJ34-2]|uniref:Transporter substrate-binding domain-containing protein n=1 Tax=Parendozoicomonas callyspongiae TaxID=2942213 RepID=A0ABT0PFG5_9GAMM|nr:transporter substrate-binding domain-containing protein [Sansalvadorimonas sp. 2012CJ34-2]MCL6270119.1 transporter substrate-binding domain-containing protein [Sansalvadorimonas sp. 2012CJ34-2]